MKKLFGKKDKDRSSPAQDDNPYARQPAQDPYANAPAPYQQQQPPRTMGLPSGPRAGAPVGLPRGPAPRAGSGGPPPPYSSPAPGPSYPVQQQGAGGGYGNDRFGAPAGYGGNRYGDNKQGPNPAVGGPPPRAGGYGGLGSLDDDDSRGGLFNDYKPPNARQNSGPRGGQNSWESGPNGPAQPGASGGGSGAYGGYGEERELTQEEQEEMQVQDIKREIIQTQQSTIQSGSRALDMLNNGTMSAANIAQALARQREHLDNAEGNIDNASVHNRIAKEQTKRLDKLNGSMFIPTGLNKKKLAALDEERMRSEQQEKLEREQARTGAYQGRMRMQGVMSDLSKPQQLGTKTNRSRREEFKFEDDDGEQEQNNQEIDDITDRLAAGVSILHGAAKVIGDELEDQINQVDRITEKVSDTHARSLVKCWGNLLMSLSAERARTRPGQEESRQSPAGGQDARKHDWIKGAYSWGIRRVIINSVYVLLYVFIRLASNSQNS
ncbi:hypothetical protein B0H67DRAFT_679405 [Lasiosphaeris hirsuta]|uniref:t-SNARE coiled-coil homology domain-containing protein n=1 Tax=Lasiosphaeris hirsuta TaxID=260670 RepID=A0AA40BCW9_9PEZI|nr:hypothetical protein B0H67DRAFT_679405 [Lasiosphaeris hirsuta]